VKQFWKYINRFDRIPACDRQMDRQACCDGTVRAMHTHCTVKEKQFLWILLTKISISKISNFLFTYLICQTFDLRDRLGFRGRQSFTATVKLVKMIEIIMKTARERTHRLRHTNECHQIFCPKNGGHVKKGLLLGGAIRYATLFCLPCHSCCAR